MIRNPQLGSTAPQLLQLESQALQRAADTLNEACNQTNIDIQRRACKDVEKQLQDVLFRNKQPTDPFSKVVYQQLLKNVADIFEEQNALWSSLKANSNVSSLESEAPKPAKPASSKSLSKGLRRFFGGQRSSPTPSVKEKTSTPLVKEKATGVKAVTPFPNPAIFTANITKLSEFPLPGVNEPFSSISQLTFCLSLLCLAGKAGASLPPEFEKMLSLNQQKWLTEIACQSGEQRRIRSMSAGVMVAFMDERLKYPAMVAEVTYLAPVLDRDEYRTLLNWIIGTIKSSSLMEMHLLEGLTAMLQGASSGYLRAGDLVSILTDLNACYRAVHKPSVEDVYRLTSAISHVLDAMVLTNVGGLDRVALHEPLLEYLRELCSHKDIFIRYQGVRAFQALLCISDDETKAIKYLRRTAGTLKAVSTIVSGVKSVDLNSIFNGFKDVKKDLDDICDVITNVYDGASKLWETGEALKSIKDGFRFDRKRPWYPALRIADDLIKDGRLLDFKTFIYDAPFRMSKEFQFGICMGLGRIALDSEWDESTRREAVEFLIDIYRNDNVWDYHPAISEWIVSILGQLGDSLNASISGHSSEALKNLAGDGDSKKQAQYQQYLNTSREVVPILAITRTIPSSTLLRQAQGIPDVESEISRIKTRSRECQNQIIYIPVQAKASLQAPDDQRFSLMDKVEEFLASERQVLLILGDSGGGKSTFNRALEQHLWDRYEEGGPVPILVNLPAIENPEKNLVIKQLQNLDLSKDDMILELKRSRTLILICDGFDEIPESHNLFNRNLFNQPGQWKVKMVISCRSTYVGRNYVELFQPLDRNRTIGGTLFQEVAITPFSKAQVQSYVRLYVDHYQPVWTVAQYLQALDKVPSLYELVTNPFLLMATLEVLTPVDGVELDIELNELTRVRLYELFINRWLERGEKRSFEKTLEPIARRTLRELSEEGFAQRGLNYLKRLAESIYREQGGNPIVQYLPLSDKRSWKGEFFGHDEEAQLLLEASPILRSGLQYRFIHRSVLEYLFSCVIFEQCSNGVGKTKEGDHLMRLQHLVKETSVIDFLSVRVPHSHLFKQHLLSLLERSKSSANNKGACNAAANAITILVQAGVPFNHARLQWIQIPGADLSHGEFDGALLHGADLTGVTFRSAWLRGADFRNAQLTNAVFGEMPFLQLDCPVYCSGFSPNGQLFAVGHKKGISVYEALTWTPLGTLACDSPVVQLAFNPLGEKIAFAIAEGWILQWDLGYEEADESWKSSGYIHSLTYSPLGESILWISLGSIFLNGHIWIWDTATGVCYRFLKYEDIDMRGVTFLPDGKQIAVIDGERTIRILDLESGCTTSVLQQSSSLLTARLLQCSANGQRIIAGSGNKILVWDVSTGGLERTLVGRSECPDSEFILDLTISSDGVQIASCGKDETVRLWDARDGSCSHILRGHSTRVTTVSFSPSGQHATSGSCDGTVRLWDTQSSHVKPMASRSGFRAISCSAYSHTADKVAIAYADGVVELRDGQTGSDCYFQWKHSARIDFMSYSRDGRYLVTGTEGDLICWDTVTGLCRRSFEGHKRSVWLMTLSPDGHTVVSGSYSSAGLCWDMETGATQIYHPHEREAITCLAFSPDGRQILSAAADRSISVWDREKKQLVFEAEAIDHDDRISVVAMSPTGIWLASGGNDNNILIWNAKSCSLEFLLRGHMGTIVSAEFSQDEKLLATGCMNRVVRVWDVATGACKAILEDFNGGVETIIRDPVRSGVFHVVSHSEKNVCRWVIEPNGDGYRMNWCWGSLDEGRLSLAAVHTEGSKGLSDINRRLLEQRRALEQ
ncbi:hypothetical protein EMPS_07203 [Entomortierella parvispora]|uniref:NACHT domain-containing protein n=1 Tax=Entomortierella parvispora TaxID=205924 RepID=A0A9P3LYG7_9FUNG|nr:hypothetical protein EMPS_07203 [Entomortierella parvispora]